MDAPEFIRVKDLIARLSELDGDLAVAIDMGDEYIAPIESELWKGNEVYVEGYGIDFIVLTSSAMDWHLSIMIGNNQTVEPIKRIEERRAIPRDMAVIVKNGYGDDEIKPLEYSHTVIDDENGDEWKIVGWGAYGLPVRETKE